MAGAGFGGAIKLTGADEYKRSLQQITQSLKENASEMQVVASAYDKGDKSLSTLKSKSEDLERVLASQKSTLEQARNAYESFREKVEQQRQAHNELVKNFEDERKKLEEIKATQGETSTAYQNQLKVVDDLAKQVTASATAYDANEKALSKLKTTMNNAEVAVNNTSREMDKLGDETEESGKKAEDASKGGYTVMKNVLANLATQAINGVVNGLKKMGSAFLDIGKQALDSYGEFEQLEGGVKKLFGDDASKAVMENARNAFATAGMSANEYMNTVTNFSASLISGLNGDTVKATELADTAIRDMADNANTFGTSIESIQNAYQGFAKGNFTMLDNLKLGYGGTKTEMLRLVKDAGVVSESVKSLDDVSFDQMIEAIHIVQENMNITGTTANEASNTIQGSVGAMKSAWQNMLTGIADDNANFTQLVDNFISTLISEDGTGGVLARLAPRITTIINGISQVIQTLLPPLIQSIVPIIANNLPVILSAVSDALKAILDLLPTIFPVIQQLIPDIVTELVNNLPQIIQTGIDLILALMQGIIDATPQLINQLPVLVEQIVRTLVNNLPKIVDTGLKLIASLIVGLYQAMGGLVAPAVKIVATAVQAIGGAIGQMVDAGKNLVRGIWDGISGAYWWIRDKISGWVGNVTSFIKNLFGIHSPSTLFRDEIGENLALGIGEGFSDEMGDVSKMMADSIPTSFDVSPTIKSSGQSQVYEMVSAFKEALSEMKIELDDENMGKFVENTVSRAVYAF